jgi:Flp pilus assembly protein TadD
MSLRHAGLVVLVVGSLAAPCGRAEAGPWLRVQSPHFTVSGNVGEDEARDVATKLEQFREVLLRLFPGARLALRPLFVVAFDSEKSYAPFKPVLEGRPAPIAGYFAWNSDGSCVTLKLDRGEDSYPTIFHEYTHLFLTQVSRRLPPWLNEGFSEYYSTVELVGHGQHANIGKPILRHLRTLPRGIMPLRDVLAVTQASRIWNDRPAAARFYATAWALVHYLYAQPGGGTLVARLVQRLQAGASDTEAFEDILGPVEKVEAALRHYSRNFPDTYQQVDFATPITAARAPARRMTPAEVEASLATILIHLRREAEAEGHVDEALKASPDLAEAHTARGLLERRRGRVAEAERAFATAVEKGPADIDAAYYWGLTVVESRRMGRDVVERALAAVAAALPRSDPPADMLTVLGVLQGLTGRLDDAEATLRLSMTLAPGQTRTTAALADVYIRQGKFDAARDLLGPMIARPNYPGEADIARSLLDWLARAEAGSRSPDARKYRQPGRDERRERGTLVAIDCDLQGIVVELKTGSGTMRFHATRLADVEFISYREDLRGSISCGARPDGETALVTWKPVTDSLPDLLGKIDGRVVAVEFPQKQEERPRDTAAVQGFPSRAFSP